MPRHRIMLVPQYKVVNYQVGGWHDYQAVYYLLLDKKPSKQFINQLENSPKWTKQEDGTYSCHWGEENRCGKCITVDKSSRVVKATYADY